MSRRVFLRDLGKGAAAAVVWTAVLPACADDGDSEDGGIETTVVAGSEATSTGTSAASTSTATSPAMTSTGTPSAATPAGTAAGSSGPAATAFEWEQVSFGFVSAYVLTRAGEAVIVDTGVSGSAPQIETGLGALGLDWGAVGHVVVTHAHPDHQGSLAEVLTRAPEAMAYAGSADIPSITAPRTVTAVGDGDSVLELQIIETPGHTPGHISVLDPAGRVLLVGDALNGEGGGVVGPNPEFTADMTVANATVIKLAELDFETILFGHGDPVEAGAANLVREIAAGL